MNTTTGLREIRSYMLPIILSSLFFVLHVYTQKRWGQYVLSNRDSQFLTTFGSDFYGKVTEMLQACRTQAWDQLIGVRKAYTPPET